MPFFLLALVLQFFLGRPFADDNLQRKFLALTQDDNLRFAVWLELGNQIEHLRHVRNGLSFYGNQNIARLDTRFVRRTVLENGGDNDDIG